MRNNLFLHKIIASFNNDSFETIFLPNLVRTKEKKETLGQAQQNTTSFQQVIEASSLSLQVLYLIFKSCVFTASTDNYGLFHKSCMTSMNKAPH